jgi:hypothetical protein
MWLFFQPADERVPFRKATSRLSPPEEQEETAARRGVAGLVNEGLLVGAPLVETE